MYFNIQVIYYGFVVYVWVSTFNIGFEYEKISLKFTAQDKMSKTLGLGVWQKQTNNIFKIFFPTDLSDCVWNYPTNTSVKFLKGFFQISLILFPFKAP